MGRLSSKELSKITGLRTAVETGLLEGAQLEIICRNFEYVFNHYRPELRYDETSIEWEFVSLESLIQFFLGANYRIIKDSL
jgi:hypothetical protein